MSAGRKPYCWLEMGLPNMEIEQLIGSAARQAVLKRRNRYAAALPDAARPRKEPMVAKVALVVETVANDDKPPAEPGIRQYLRSCQRAAVAAAGSAVMVAVEDDEPQILQS